MKDKTFTVELKCLFCDCILPSDIEKEYSSGDLIKCQECNELNDYDSLVDIATDEGKKLVKEYAQKEIEQMLKNVYK